MKFQYIIIISMIVFFSCKENKNSSEKASEDSISKQKQTEVKQDNSFLISCDGVGKLNFSMNYSDVEKLFGKEKLKTDTILAGTPMMDEEKNTQDRISTRINTPEGRLYITWQAGKQANVIEKISVLKNSKYHFENGIQVGSSLRDLVQANNNQAFEFYGFGWQYGGMVINETAQGDFFKQYPCFVGSLTPKSETYDKVQNFMGDSKFKSDAQGLPLDEIVLQEITITNPKLK
ncbi:MAG: hypothetical protein MUC49_09000 [Raineya sp.]|jgi:hypothetical protein|nr:hypothetical protein [Raineya sp.]